MADATEDADFDERRWRAEHRYRAVLEVLDGASVTQVARQYGASRQSVHTWMKRFEAEGVEGLVERSQRPKTSPTRLPAEVEALICEMRRDQPRWGPRRIAHELARQRLEPVPGRTTVYRVLVRNGLVQHQEQNHRRVYRRWQRDAPMQLWQMDIMGGVFLADGRECKLVTGIDDHSRFIVIAQVVAQPSGRAVCQAFTDAMGRYGVPSEVLTDNGKQFTGRFTKPFPAEVMFERICRENGITARLTKPRTPTTTGKIERWHKTLRRELLDAAGPFESMQAAQQAVDAWLHGYNHSRPHQSLDMATPAETFRPTSAHLPQPTPARPTPEAAASPRPSAPITDGTCFEAAVVTTAEHHDDDAVEIDMVISPGGRICLPANQQFKFSQALAGRPVAVWANRRSIHVIMDGEVVRTRTSRFSAADLDLMRQRSDRPARPEPAASALPASPASAATVIEVERTVSRDGTVNLGGGRIHLASHLAGQRIALRLDGHLMHVIAGGRLVKTLPSPVAPDERAKLSGARTATSALPPPPAPPARVLRTIAANGHTSVARQRINVGTAHAGKTVTIIIEETVFRVLHNDIEISTHTRKATGKPNLRLRGHS